MTDKLVRLSAAFLLLTPLLLIPSTSFAIDAMPAFAITNSTYVLTSAPSAYPSGVYSNFTKVGQNQYHVEDNVLSATMMALGHNQWSLAITAKQNIGGLFFPWEIKRQTLGDKANEIFYSMEVFGIARQATAYDQEPSTPGHKWTGGLYAANYPAPLAVLADSNQAFIVAAENWPPKAVHVCFGGERIVLFYHNIPNPSQPLIAAGTSATYQTLFAQVPGDAAQHILPWQAALDLYRGWLNQQPIDHSYPPAWMWQGEGLLHVFTPVYSSFTQSSNFISNTWNQWKSTFPLIEFWAQQCALRQAGCTPDVRGIDSRLLPDLPNFAKEVATGGGGYHLGYYTIQSANSTPPVYLDTPEGQKWTMDWIRENETMYHSNTSGFADTLNAGIYSGDPGKLVELFHNGSLAQDVLAERPVDAYPVAALISGALEGAVCGAPNGQVSDPPSPMALFAHVITVPQFGRYLLNDRLVYEGKNSADVWFWGDQASWRTESKQQGLINCGWDNYCTNATICDNGDEILAFLLGAKFDVPIEQYYNIPHNGYSSLLPIMVEEHKKVNWWNRRPVYWDTKGLDLTGLKLSPSRPNVPLAVRHFVDNKGQDLFVTYNGSHTPGLSFVFGRKTIPVPVSTVSIIDLNAPH